jgi:hypothetical protein
VEFQNTLRRRLEGDIPHHALSLNDSRNWQLFDRQSLAIRDYANIAQNQPYFAIHGIS